jgi:hypothetical protein
MLGGDAPAPCPGRGLGVATLFIHIYSMGLFSKWLSMINSFISVRS